MPRTSPWAAVGATIAALCRAGLQQRQPSLTGGADLTTTGGFSNSGNLTVGAGSTLKVAGNFTQTAAGTLDVQLGGTPASGQFGQLVATGSAALGGDLNVSLVNGFNPTLGQDFQYCRSPVSPAHSPRSGAPFRYDRDRRRPRHSIWIQPPPARTWP